MNKMRLFTSILATVAMLAMAPAAFAAVTYTVVATTSDSSPLGAVTPGAKITLDITVRTDDFAIGLEGSVNNYDNSVVSLDLVGSSISASFFNSVCYAPLACFNGLNNLIGSSIPLGETTTPAGEEVAFLAGLSVSGGAAGDGSLDQDPFGNGVGAAQFQIVFDAIGAPGASTTMAIGTFLPFGDLYTGTVDAISNNTAVSITIVPEPAAIATSLAAISSVFGVVAIRRRML
jgi:hypothetical protein